MKSKIASGVLRGALTTVKLVASFGALSAVRMVAL
jgi:hypothetical protein